MESNDHSLESHAARSPRLSDLQSEAGGQARRGRNTHMPGHAYCVPKVRARHIVWHGIKRSR
eukprot:3609443-Pyramimonas_sp.AAC.1